MLSQLSRGLDALGLTPHIPQRGVQQLADYGHLLLQQNQVMNLTAITQPQQVAQLHMLDSAALLTQLSFEGKRLLDVGSGAGLPGIPLKILVPSLQVTLLDSLGKRVNWLQQVCATLKLQDIWAVHARAEEQAHLPLWREQFDIVCARGLAQLPILAELCLPYVKVDGVFLAMKSTHCEEELHQAAYGLHLLGSQFERSFDYTIPETSVTHRVFVFTKVTPSPAAYPRRWKRIQSHPLSQEKKV